MKDGNLTEKQKRFIDCYLATGGNGTEAARCAGYSPKSADDAARYNLNHPVIKAAIKERQQLKKEQRTADIDEIRMYWTSIMRGELTEKAYDTKGNEFDREASLQARMKASENLAKSCGGFADKAKKEVEMNIIWIEDYGPEDSSEME